MGVLDNWLQDLPQAAEKALKIVKHVFDNPLGGWLAPLAFGALAWYCRADLAANALAASVVILAELVFVVVALFYPYAYKRFVRDRQHDLADIRTAFEALPVIQTTEARALRDAIVHLMEKLK